MKTVVRLPIFLGFVLSILSFTGSAQNYSEQELQEIFLDALTDIGVEGYVDSDGDVQFEYSGHNYYIGVDESDQEFVNVVLFNVWPIESNSEAVEVVFACDAVNRQAKVAKAYTNNDNVWIAAELFLGSPRDMAELLERCLEAVEAGLDIFVENM